MRDIIQGAAVALILTGIGASHVEAQTLPRQGPARDLGVEVETQAQPKPRPARPAQARAVQVSLMPIGPSTVPIGQPLRFRMVSLSNGFGHLFVLSASGRTQLWFENIRLTAGKPITFPGRGLTVRASAPAGDDSVIFVASRTRSSGFVSSEAMSKPVELQLTHDALRQQIEQKFSNIPRRSWAFSEIKIRVVN
jgi:hypothetical protein